MFQRFWKFTKSHPWLVGGSVLGVVVLIWLLTRKSGETTPTGIWAMTADPNIVSAEAQKSISQNQLNAAVNMANISSSRDIELAKLESGVATNYLSTLQSISEKQFSSQVTMREREITGMENLANIESALQQKLAEFGNIAARDQQSSVLSLARLQEDTERLRIAATERTQKVGILGQVAGKVADAQRAAYQPGGWQFGNPLGNDAYQALLQRFG